MKNFGDNKLHFEVLDVKRRNLLDKLIVFKEDFYLAGGTALALQIGHRISVDFDFFTSEPFDNEKFLTQIENIFLDNSVAIIQNEKDTITILLDNEVKLSFFHLPYSNLYPLIATEYFYIAQIKEIGIMKLLALFRATFKDYVDIYFILKQLELSVLIEGAKKKHPNFDKTMYLKALISFDDVDEIPILFVANNEIKRKDVFSFIEEKVVEFIKQNK